MSSSGTYTFTLNRDQVITRAFQLINIYDLNSTISSDDLEYADDMLNMMLLYWSGQGVRLWKRKQAYLFPQKDIAQYNISLSGDNVTNSYVSTTVTNTASAAATSITVSSTTGMTIGDNIGIELDSGTRQWTTISNIAGLTISLDAALSGAAATDNTVITYTNKIPRPLRIIRATNLDLKSDNTETTMQILGFDEYLNMPSKDTPGTPNNLYYDKQLVNGVMHFFPRTDEVSKIITFTYVEPIQDTGDSTDEIEIPKEWLLPIVWNLGVELAYAYGEFPALDKIEPRAKELFETVKYYDSDDESLRLGSRY